MQHFVVNLVVEKKQFNLPFQGAFKSVYKFPRRCPGLE